MQFPIYRKTGILIILLSLTVLIGCTTQALDIPEQNMTLWEDQTDIYLPLTAEWTNRVEVADINYDGLPDILMANGGDYSSPGTAEPLRIFLNRGPNNRFEEVTNLIKGNRTFHARVVKVQDINQDGFNDIIIGTTYEAKNELFLGTEDGSFLNATSTHLPDELTNTGDLELGDVNGDGALDIVLAEWGSGDAMNNEGGVTMLWLNDGTGHFTNVTQARMPSIKIEFSWDLELFDYDNDFDLDIAISCKRCGTSRIYVNDGQGNFEDKRLLPAYTNNYDFEIMDLNGDGYLDLVTINDGDIVNGQSWSRKEHIFLNDSARRFIDATSILWPDSSNIGEDDNNIIITDFDNDGDSDFIISSLSGYERLLINDGKAHFSLMQPIMDGPETSHTLSLVMTDINNDGRPDMVMGQGEGRENIEERIYIGKNIEPDTRNPTISHYQITPGKKEDLVLIQARIHDGKSQMQPHEWESVAVYSKDSIIASMQWYGEYLWRAEINQADVDSLNICAVDAAGNKSCIKLNP
jgi:hypothetical protein